MTETDLMPLLEAFGLLPTSTRTVGRPRLDKALRSRLAKVKRAHRDELTAAKIMRADVLNYTRGLDRPRIVDELVAEGHTEAAYLLSFNNDQLALLMAWRDVLVGPGSSSNVEDFPGVRANEPGAAE